ncbi:fructose-bisphosphate aldolase B-like [Microplitis mediator]|uniref:fructose-bisphosphate aldolase B-like n=1 Tax=Microplitis mediator TaxID=375433 RepID=UPI0025560252|nr:fructose-bisphosphate aldolase B-like [Microplitis mediator]
MKDVNKNCPCEKYESSFEVKNYKKFDHELTSELKRIMKLLIKPKKGFLDLSEPRDKFPEPSNLKFLNGFSDVLSSDELSEYVTGVIVDSGTAISMISSGSWKLPKVMMHKNIVTGVRIDQGRVPLFGTYDEKVTQGLDGLHDKCLMLKKNNCHFTTWKIEFKISDQWPSSLAVIDNALTSARYASVTQSTGMIPIINLQIKNLPKANYSIFRALDAHHKILSTLFSSLNQYHVSLENLILMLAIIEPGINNPAYHQPCTLADYTSSLLSKVLPASVPAIIFTHTNNSPEEKFIINLNALARDSNPKSWKLSFHCLRTAGNPSKNISMSTLALIDNLKKISEASDGQADEQELYQSLIRHWD